MKDLPIRRTVRDESGDIHEVIESRKVIDTSSMRPETGRVALGNKPYYRTAINGYEVTEKYGDLRIVNGEEYLLAEWVDET